MMSTPNRLSGFGALIAVIALTACSEAPVAPIANHSPSPAAPDAAVLAADFVNLQAQFGWLPQLAPAKSLKGDTTVQTVTMDPKDGAVIHFGSNHKVVVYPWAICDPATSGYGPGYWMAPCRQATKNITFTFKSYTNQDGRPAVLITPDVRFVPGAFVRIYFHDATLVNFDSVVIPWCDKSGSCLDEGLSDPFQRTYYAPGTPGFWVFRNLRHFSGYNVWA